LVELRLALILRAIVPFKNDTRPSTACIKIANFEDLCFAHCMSRIADDLYFAPEITFAKLDIVRGERLPTQFRQRMAGFYLNPAIDLAEDNHAFAAGVLVVCAIDALALLTAGSQSTVTERITAYCRNIPELTGKENARIFCESFRHGLVHHARVKDGNEFSNGISKIAVRHGQHLAVNPLLLAKKVLEMLDAYVEDLNRNPASKAAFLKKIKRTFKYELSQ
jgi:hypothetical protein